MDTHDRDDLVGHGPDPRRAQPALEAINAHEALNGVAARVDTPVAPGAAPDAALGDIAVGRDTTGPDGSGPSGSGPGGSGSGGFGPGGFGPGGSKPGGASPRGPGDSPRALVTGAAGFLGSHLCDRLLAQGRRVMGVDNLMTGRRRNLAHLRDHPRFEFAFHDVLTPFSGQFDEIWHLACPASPPAYQADPIATARIAFEGTLNMLRLAEGCGARILVASTSEVYGDPDVHPQREDYLGAVNPVGRRACYDEGKRIAETLAFDFHRERGVAVRVARIFNTYGPRMNASDGRVVSNFIVQALSGEDITLYGDGSQTRSFCYVHDLIEGLVRLMASEDTGPVNIGNPNEFTVRELAEKVLAMTDASSRLVLRNLPQDDPRRRRPDIRLARETLGWSPRVELEEGLRHTIAHFAAELALEAAVDGTDGAAPERTPNAREAAEA